MQQQSHKIYNTLKLITCLYLTLKIQVWVHLCTQISSLIRSFQLYSLKLFADSLSFIFSSRNNFLGSRHLIRQQRTFYSEQSEITYGVPPGSILWPLLFNMLPLTHIKATNTISCHNYADDTQHYITVSPDDFE